MRYLPLTKVDRTAMLERIGAGSIDDLFRDVPPAARLTEPLDLPPHAGELEVERAIGRLADDNLSAARAPCFLGAGAYRHHIPAAVSHLTGRSEFLTSYTPYQPEISQGTLQYLFEFQSQVARITGMEVANASMYDGSTGCAEAVLMARRITKKKRVVLSGGLHPQYISVARTMTKFSDTEIVALPPSAAGPDDLIPAIDKATSCVVVQNPSFFGHLTDLSDLAEAAHGAGALLIVVITEVVSLGAVKSPGDMGADIVVCEGQSIGNALNFGGPYLGLFATRQRYLRQMPGRLCGQTRDSLDRPGYVLTLSTREQHIRREKATSNICTNSGLCALAFCIHLSLLGEAGFTRLAALNHEAAIGLADRIDGIDGAEVVNQTYFNEFTVRLSKPAAQVAQQLADGGILGGVPVSRLYPDTPDLADLLLVAVTETVTGSDIEALIDGLREALS